MKNSKDDSEIQLEPDFFLPQHGWNFPEPTPAEFDLSNIIATTRMLGDRVFASQVLARVAPEATDCCPKCDERVCRVKVANLDFYCDVETRGSMMLANLIADHHCQPTDGEMEETKLFGDGQ